MPRTKNFVTTATCLKTDLKKCECKNIIWSLQNTVGHFYHFALLGNLQRTELVKLQKWKYLVFVEPLNTKIWKVNENVCVISIVGYNFHVSRAYIRNSLPACMVSQDFQFFYKNSCDTYTSSSHHAPFRLDPDCLKNIARFRTELLEQLTVVTWESNWLSNSTMCYCFKVLRQSWKTMDTLSARRGTHTASPSELFQDDILQIGRSSLGLSRSSNLQIVWTGQPRCKRRRGKCLEDPASAQRFVLKRIWRIN
jgi:hypothetical protein